jgi:TorA-specific chaperone
MSAAPSALRERGPSAAPAARPAEDADLAALLVLAAALFAAPPQEATIASLRHGAAADLMARLAGDDALAGPIAALAEKIAGDEDAAAVARRLAPVFGLLFLGLAGPATVAPYESVHRCGGRLYQAPVGEMERLLADHDLAVGFDREPADHLSIETALLAHLVATAHPDRHALAERLRGWLPAFRAGVAAADGSGVWAAAAALLAAAIDRASHPREPTRQA